MRTGEVRRINLPRTPVNKRRGRAEAATPRPFVPESSASVLRATLLLTHRQVVSDLLRLSAAHLP